MRIFLDTYIRRPNCLSEQKISLKIFNYIILHTCLIRYFDICFDMWDGVQRECGLKLFGLVFLQEEILSWRRHYPEVLKLMVNNFILKLLLLLFITNFFGHKNWIGTCDVRSPVHIKTKSKILHNFFVTKATDLKLYFWKALETWRNMCHIFF